MLFQIPVCAKANATYISRPDVIVGFFFFTFLMIAASMAYLLKRVPNLLLMFPIIFFIIFCRTMNGNKGYIASTDLHIPEENCRLLTNDFIRQLQEADQAGKDSVELHVPMWGTEGNHPQTDLMGQRMERTLYSHNMLTHHLNVVVIPDEKINEKYHISNVGK